MRIAKPLLLVSTPLGMAWGLFEGWRLAGGLVLLMALMMGVVGAGVASIVRIVRAEEAAARSPDAANGRAAIGAGAAAQARGPGWTEVRRRRQCRYS
jgi:hypothetical protein